MYFLQTVQAVQHQTEFVIAILCESLAARAGRSGIVELVGSRQFIGKDQALAVEKEVKAFVGGQGKIAHRLEGNQIQSLLLDQVNTVISQANHQLVTVAVKTVAVAFLDQRGLSRLVETILGSKVKKRGHVGKLHKEVVILEPEDILVKINDHGESVLPGVAGHGTGCLEAETVAVFVVLIPDDHVEQVHPVVEFNIWQIVCAVQEVQRHFLAGIIAHQIKGELGAGDLAPILRKSCNSEG